tara:strand:+ start:153 stop:1448 length:1296 start_codon:yes stop_codon:yes gene_type:complete
MAISFPIMGGMISQNVLNLVDTAMVGQLGTAALAAVGIGGLVNFFCQSALLGFSSGVQAIAARRLGEGRKSEVANPLNGGLLIVAVLGVLLTFLLLKLIPIFFPILNPDPEVVGLGQEYLMWRVTAITFVAMNYAFRGYWNAVNLSKIYMGTLICMHLLNIFLNYVLIFGNFGFPELGVKGAAIGTSLSMLFGTFLYMLLAFRLARSHGFFQRWPSLKSILNLLKVSIPASTQQIFFSAGLTTLFYIIGLIGTAETAAAHVLINIMLVCILPGVGFGLGAASLVGQALGRKDQEDAYEWGMDVVKIAIIYISGIGFLLVLFPEYILQIFLVDPITRDLAILPLQFTGLFIGLDAAGLVLMHSLLGAGDSRRVMIISILCQWLFFLPAAYIAGPILGVGLLGVWILQGFYRILQASLFYGIWRTRAWAGIQL